MEKLETGQSVEVQVDDKRIKGVFIRLAVLQARGEDREVAWVRRADTGEIEPFTPDLVSAA